MKDFEKEVNNNYRDQRIDERFYIEKVDESKNLEYNYIITYRFRIEKRLMNQSANNISDKRKVIIYC